MTPPPVLERARSGDDVAFRELTDPFRRELLLHCYRILGSLHDAEDLLQETLLAAWRGLDGFEQRASIRAWLYRIATNRCLNALRDRGRRPAETELVLPDHRPEPTREFEPTWLTPFPDAPYEEGSESAPEARYEMKEAVGLAFVSGLQHLSPRQRAVLVLRDVLGFAAAEVAEMLDTSEAGVNSALQRARAALDGRLAAADRERAPLPRSLEERRLVDRFARAFESGDVDGVVALLTEDARLTMPPAPVEYEGRTAIREFLSTIPAGGHLERFTLVPTRANGQPAFGFYVRDPQCTVGRASGIMVLTLEGDEVAAITAFHDSTVLAHFGLPRMLPI